jgi:hypothetical protein
MNSLLFIKLHYIAVLFLLWILITPTLVQANDADNKLCSDQLEDESGNHITKKWDLTLSPYTYHWHYNPDHKRVFLGAIDRHIIGNRFCGLALFTNSFGQNSAYLYAGKQWDGFGGNPQIFSKVTAGLIYGYHGQYKDKIPFNNYGIAPAIIPSVGYKFSPNQSAQIFVLGAAGLLFAYGYSY